MINVKLISVVKNDCIFKNIAQHCLKKILMAKQLREVKNKSMEKIYQCVGKKFFCLNAGTTGLILGKMKFLVLCPETLAWVYQESCTRMFNATL